MTNKYNKGKPVRNGTRYVFDEDRERVFPRDVDRLFLEYTNLRMQLYNTYKRYFQNEETQDELMSYINEQFVKLTKEYDIHGPVDFPGYIKKKLTMRVQRVFVKNQFRDRSRETLTKEEGIIETILEGESEVDGTSVEDYDFLKFVFTGFRLDDVEKYIVDQWLSDEPVTNHQIVKDVVDKFGLKRSEANRYMRELKECLKRRVEEYNEE